MKFNFLFFLYMGQYRYPTVFPKRVSKWAEKKIDEFLDKEKKRNTL